MSGNIDPRKKYARQKKSCAGLTTEQKRHRVDCQAEANKEFVLKPQRIKPKPKPPGPVPPGPTPPRPDPNIPSLPRASDPFSAIAYSGRRQLGTSNVNPAVIAGSVSMGAGAVALGASRMFAPATAPAGAYRPLPIDEPFDPQAEEFPEEPETGDVESGLTQRRGFQFSEEGAPAEEAPEGVEMQQPSYMDGVRARLSGRPSGYSEVQQEDPDEDEAEEPTETQPGGEVEMTGQKPPGSMEDVPLDEEGGGQTPSGYQEVPTEEPEEGDDLSDLMDEVRQSQEAETQAQQQVSEQQTEQSEVESAEAEEGETADVQPGTEYTQGIQDRPEGDFDEDDDVDDEPEQQTEQELEAGQEAEEGAEAGEGVAEDALLEGAGEASVLGPIGDAVAVAMLVAGAGLAIAGAVAQANQSSGAPSAPGMPKSAKATVLSGSDYTNFVNGLQEQINKASGTTKSQLQQQLRQVQSAKSNGRQITVFKSDGQTQVGVQMNSTQLAQAIMAYQRNPNVFKGVSPARLQAMGLNPNMSLGEAGGHTVNGVHYPGSAKQVSAQGSNIYLSSVSSGTTSFKDQNSIQNQAFSTRFGGNSIHRNYVSNAEEVIAKQTNPQVKAYLTYQLQMYEYENGMIKHKPATVSPPSGQGLQTAETAEQQTRRQLQQVENAVSQQATNLTSNVAITQAQGTETAAQRLQYLQSQLDLAQMYVGNFPKGKAPSGLTNSVTNYQSLIASLKSANPSLTASTTTGTVPPASSPTTPSTSSTSAPSAPSATTSPTPVVPASTPSPPPMTYAEKSRLALQTVIQNNFVSKNKPVPQSMTNALNNWNSIIAKQASTPPPPVSTNAQTAKSTPLPATAPKSSTPSAPSTPTTPAQSGTTGTKNN